ALFPPSVDPTTRPTTQSFGRFDATGPFGSAYAPVAPGAGGAFQEDIRLAIPTQRLEDRRFLLGELDRARWAMDAAGAWSGLDELRQQAFQTVLGGVADAFDLSREPAETIARYDTSLLVTPEAIS